MASDDTITLNGKSGKVYDYYTHPFGESFKPAPGNYVFVKKDSEGINIIYIGETGDISERFDSHHKMDDIKSAGATHILTHTGDANEKIRKTEEQDLIDNYDPPCNG